MKQCATCGKLKDESEYNWRNKTRGKKWGTCRDCQSKQQKRWYKKNRKTHIFNSVERRLSKQEQGRKYVWNYLSNHPCRECGESDPIVLEFHHVRNKKETVMRLVRDGYSVERIRKEIDNCVVLCANCHKRQTYKDSWRDR